MKPQIIFGILLLLLGAVLFIVGMNASHSIADRVSDTFFGRFTEGTTWYLISGVGAAAGGVYLLVANWTAKRI